MAKAQGPKEPEVIDEAVEIIPRVDPAMQAEIDGDPAYDFRLKDGPDGIPPDLAAVWCHRDVLPTYKGRRWRDARPEDGIEFLSGIELEPGERIWREDHCLLIRDKAYDQAVRDAERVRGRKTREAIVKGANKSIHVNVPGSGPQAMLRR